MYIMSTWMYVYNTYIYIYIYIYIYMPVDNICTCLWVYLIDL